MKTVSFNIESFKPVILWGCVVSFVAAVYFLTSSISQQNVKKSAIDALISQGRILRENERMLGEYSQIKDALSAIDLQGKALSWEDVSAVWTDVTIDEVIKRLEGLYLGDKRLVISEFAVNDNIANEGNSVGATQSEKRSVFKVKGFLLCNCP